MAKKAEGWLRKKKYADGETWLFCYYTTRPEDNKRVEHSQRVGLVKDFPIASPATCRLIPVLPEWSPIRKSLLG
jgi:hypothetical protein